ncbi:MAG: hypothetical protein ACI96M_000477 [Candidatus Azotimanducaceae bacterium]|jgi:hypothetical protein
MTDHELITIFIEFVNTTWTIFGTFVSIVFAFIVASYLAASRLTSKVVLLVITLYTLVAAWSVWGISMNANSISATVGEMKRRLLEESSSLGWLPILGLPDYMLPVIPILITCLASVVYIGSIVFFFYQRRIE